jgi:hypothetical protein
MSRHVSDLSRLFLCCIDMWAKTIMFFTFLYYTEINLKFHFFFDCHFKAQTNTIKNQS